MITSSIKTLFDSDVRDFSIYSCSRNIPSLVDGLKPSQRKVVFGMKKKFPRDEVKVSIASAGIMEISAYHHGSLDGVVVKMAQSFPGSNNLPLLEGIGQFGSRISGDAAASRYIFVKTSKAFNELFMSVDDGILNYQQDDGELIEPEYYLPIVPLVLINGADGTATGYATHILEYNPNDVKDAIVAILKGKTPKVLTPWYRGFTGDISKVDTQWVIKGKLEVKDSTTLKITELPVGVFTTNYRSVLNDLEAAGHIKTYDDNSNEEKTEFIVKATREFVSKPIDVLMKMFKLVSKDTENITVWTEDRKLKRFDTVDDLLKHFVAFRTSMYQNRKDFLISEYEEDISWMKEQIRFIQLYLASSQDWAKKEHDEILSILKDHSFTRPEDLLGIRIARLTKTAIQNFMDQVDTKERELNTLKSTSIEQLYLDDLSKLKF